MSRPFGRRYAWVYKFLALRDGEKCFMCKRAPPKVKLIVEHKDNDETNWDESNLRLACRSCNKKLSLPNVKERKKTENPTQAVRDHVDYQQGSAEMQASDLMETPYWHWIKAKITALNLKGEDLPKKEAINGGAYTVGCSTTTSRKYLDKLTSEEGPLKEVKTEWKVKVIRFR